MQYVVTECLSQWEPSLMLGLGFVSLLGVFTCWSSSVVTLQAIFLHIQREHAVQKMWCKIYLKCFFTWKWLVNFINNYKEW